MLTTQAAICARVATSSLPMILLTCSFDGARADNQRLGNLAVVLALRDQRCNAALARGQAARRAPGLLERRERRCWYHCQCSLAEALAQPFIVRYLARHLGDQVASDIKRIHRFLRFAH